MKDFEEDDPMSLQAVALPAGNPEVQARLIIDEFLSMGTEKERLLEIFRDPFYMGTYHLHETLGEKRIQELLQECSTGAFSVTLKY